MLDQPLIDQPLIKVILLVGIIGVTVLLTRSTAGARHQAVRRLLLIGFVAMAAMAIMFPPLLTQVARAVGVGRGADLLLYGLTITFLGYVAASYRRMRQLEQQNTVLARQLALNNAVHDVRQHGTGGEASTEQLKVPRAPRRGPIGSAPRDEEPR